MAADLEIRIAAEFTEVKAAVAALKRDLAGVGDAANRAGNNRALGNIERGLSSAAAAARNLLGGFAALAGFGAIIRLADEIATLDARLKLATRSTDELVRAQDELFGIAQRTRSGLRETVELYTRLAQATREAGISQSTLLSITETVNQAVQLSGVSAQAAEAALVQFGQGLSSGALRGEELNSILEQTPGLADAIAKGLGVTRGELRSLGEQGRLTSDALIAALQKVAPQVRADFEQLPLTVGQAITKVGNSLTRLVGIFDQATGGTRGLASVLNELAELLSSEAFTSGVQEFATLWGQAFRDIVDDAKRAISTIREATSNFLGSQTDIFGFLFRAIRDLPANLRASVRIAVVTFAGMIDAFKADIQLLVDLIKLRFGLSSETFDAVIARRNAAVNAAATAVQEQITDIVDETQRAKAEAEAQVKDLQQQREAAKRRAATAATPPPAQRAAVGRADALALQKDAAERAAKALEQLYKDANLSLEAYLNRRVELNLQAIDAEIAAEQRKLVEARKARKEDEANKALTKIETLRRDRTDVVAQAEADRLSETRKFADARLEVEAKRLEQQGQLEQAALLRLRAQYADTLKRLRVEGDVEGEKIVDAIINTEAARARFQELQAEAERIQAALSSRLQSVADQRSSGSISADAAQSGQREARAEAIRQLGELNQKLAELAARTNDPEIVKGAEATAEALARIRRDGLEGTDLAVANLIASLDNMRANFAATVADTAVDGIADFFTSIADGSKSAGEALRDFVRDFARSMAQVAARALATFLVLQALDAVFPGLGRTVAAASGASANVRHSGGMAGQGPRREVPGWLFAGAPRFHSGGTVPGLAPDEVPAILQTGEEVLSRNDPRNAKNGGAGGVRIINTIDPNLVDDYMSSPGGERTILNTITRNRGQIRQALA